MHDPRFITVTLVRHAPTIYPKGTLPPVDPDVDLTDQAQITRLAQRLPDQAEWWISPLSRCRKTAEALIEAGATPASQAIDPQLVEQDYGEWHGQSVAAIWDAVKDGPKSNWHFLHASVTPPGGESFNDLCARLEAVMTRIMETKADELVLIAHGMVIRALIGLALGKTPGEALAMDVAPLSMSQLTFIASNDSPDDDAGGRWMINRLNSGG
ncbi:MAG: histidine phosphatase family protein [Alphaproteobacteria bacterium]|nr:histidine phosphatase family protein [Alphaproteobacteria bacterium]